MQMYKCLILSKRWVPKWNVKDRTCAFGWKTNILNR